jgi:hypothetical protein
VPRAIDEPIPPDEPLYMVVSSDNIDGEKVLAAAVAIPCQSTNRHKYNPDPSDVISAARRNVAAAGIAPNALPPPESTSTADARCFFRAEDDPQDENPAHSEIRVHRPGQVYSAKFKPGPTTKTLLREELARRLRIVYRLA